jgi:hypothetical protein
MIKLFLAFALMSWMSFALSDEHLMKTPTDLEWMTGPETLPPGSQMSVIDGSPKLKGPFTMRLKFPANFKIPTHWHSKDENITVIEGDFSMGMGEKLDETKAHLLPAGGYAKMPMKMRHYAFAGVKGAIVQLHGMGPFDITYVNPSDDPRKKKP